MTRRTPRSTRTDTLFPYTTLFRSFLAAGARLDQFKAAAMHGDVLLPDVEAGVVHTIAEQGALERRVVAEDHRKRVERKDVAGLDDTIGHRVVGTVHIDAGLEPGPGVHQLDIGKRFRNLADHGIGRGNCDLMDRKSTRLNSSH